jgi:uncharacterized membrane protein
MDKSGAGRVFELDALRGLALLLMVLHHLIYDLRYLYQLDVFAFQETWWFANLLRPVFLNVFLIVSGICCTFSRSNTRRGLRLLAVSLGFTAATSLASWFSGQNFYILFNILHVLALGTLLYAALTRKEKKQDRRQPGIDVLLLLLAAAVIWLAGLLPHWQAAGSYWLLPLGLYPEKVVDMADYLPIIPWLGFFLVGAVIGRQVYASRQTAFPGAPGWLLKAGQPLAFLGRNSLLIYVLHQPFMLALLAGLRVLGLL